jgi:NitT/TauT family transport system permease protein
MTLKRFLPPLITIAILLAGWEGAVHVFSIKSYVLPYPSDVLMRMGRDWRMLLDHSGATALAVLAGLTVSIGLGVAVALVMAADKRVEHAVMPIISALQCIPKIAIAPILIIWFGFGLLPKVISVILLATFPIIVATFIGLTCLDEEMLDLVRAMRARRWKIMVHVRFPAALPHVFAGVRIAMSLSVIGAVIGEFAGSDRGLGYLILVSAGALDTSLTWAALLILAAMGISLYAAAIIVEKMTIPWHVSSRSNQVM